MPIYGKSLKNLLWNQKADDLESLYVASGVKYYFMSTKDQGHSLTLVQITQIQ